MNPYRRQPDYHHAAYPQHSHTPPPLYHGGHPNPYQQHPQYYQAPQRFYHPGQPQYSIPQPQHYGPPQPHTGMPQQPLGAQQPPVPQMQQHPQYPRSPMVVSSQPHMMRPPVTHSPRTMPPHVHQTPLPIPPPAVVASPAPMPIPTHAPTSVSKPNAEEAPPLPRRESVADAVASQSSLLLPPEYKQPFWPPQLPWYSSPKGAADFPPRANRRRRRRRNNRASIDAVALPVRGDASKGGKDGGPEEPIAEEQASETSTIAAPSEPETRATSQAPSESEYTQASTPTTPMQVLESSPKPTPTPTVKHTRKDTRSAIAVPNLPVLPKAKEASPTVSTDRSSSARAGSSVTPKAHEQEQLEAAEPTTPATTEKEPIAQTPQAPKPTAPKSWAEMARRGAPATPVSGLTNGTPAHNGILPPKSTSLADVIKQYNVNHDNILSFLEPRGLVNTGNMCYMNSILQVLVFCMPFYSFLDQVRIRTVQAMKSDTPLIDAMIMFMREFNVLGSAESADTLRAMLKPEQLETYGEPVTPEYVYDVIKKLPRFAGMRRGHQQDAEEFLGFLLEGLHDECVAVMQGAADDNPAENGVSDPDGTSSAASLDGWHEVGPKQKASITRTSGQQDAPTPITKIFGGHLRSEFQVPGQKNSVTLEPYKPLQLDIGAPNVNNIVDALKSITNLEHLTGDFGGKNSTARKQVFIEDLPPVLILHLKRFQYDNTLTGTQKIWKKVGYPLELDIPKEVFAPNKRAGLVNTKTLPRYRLTSVVYHHGKSAAGGHYTVDVLRQDSREWVRMDDTAIRRIRPEDVAEGGAEEDPKVLAQALERHQREQEASSHPHHHQPAQPAQRNMYQGLDAAEKEPEEERPWSEVNGNAGHAKKWSGVVNGTTTTTGLATPGSGKKSPPSRKEGGGGGLGKVAYILLYERMRG